MTLPLDIYEDGSAITFVACDKKTGEVVIKKQFTEIQKLPDGKVKIALKFSPNDTKNIEINGSKLVLNGEFEIRKPNGTVISLPQNNKYIKVVLYADLVRGDDD